MDNASRFPELQQPVLAVGGEQVLMRVVSYTNHIFLMYLWRWRRLRCLRLIQTRDLSVEDRLRKAEKETKSFSLESRESQIMM